jgi:hypothetical protein
MNHEPENQNRSFRFKAFFTQASMTKRSTLDRSIPVILNDPDNTPSLRDGISASTERLHRLHATSLISSAWRILGKQIKEAAASSCYAIACTILHRFYHCVSLKHTNVWSIAMGATLLAAKMEEETEVTVYRIILAFSHIYRRRLLIMIDEDMSKIQSVTVTPALVNQTMSEKLECLRQTTSVSALSPLSPMWKDWYSAMIDAENHILRVLGFTLYWIAPRHPHKFIAPFLKTLDEKDLDKNKNKIAQSAWSYCNDSFRLDLTTRFDSSVVACAALYLALVEDSQQGVANKLADSSNGERDDLTLVCIALLGLRDPQNIDVKLTSFCFIPSLEQPSSFNDPGSFLGEQTIEDLTRFSATTSSNRERGTWDLR